MRFPRIARIRTDKAPTEIDTLETAWKIAKAHLTDRGIQPSLRSGAAGAPRKSEVLMRVALREELRRGARLDLYRIYLPRMGMGLGYES
jgi:hypothetical protein